jgi:hypothetical protein
MFYYSHYSVFRNSLTFEFEREIGRIVYSVHVLFDHSIYHVPLYQCMYLVQLWYWAMGIVVPQAGADTGLAPHKIKICTESLPH